MEWIKKRCFVALFNVEQKKEKNHRSFGYSKRYISALVDIRAHVHTLLHFSCM